MTEAHSQINLEPPPNRLVLQVPHIYSRRDRSIPCVNENLPSITPPPIPALGTLLVDDTLVVGIDLPILPGLLWADPERVHVVVIVRAMPEERDVVEIALEDDIGVMNRVEGDAEKRRTLVARGRCGNLAVGGECVRRDGTA